MELGFILKKIISAMIMPLSLGLILGLIGLIFLFRNKLLKAKLFLIVSFIWISFISYAPFSNFLIKPLETQYEEVIDISEDIKYIVLLGGDFDNRAWEVLRLYHKIKDVKIITSGYAGRGEVPEAIKNANKLMEVGIPKENIIIHVKPKDTKEEAILLKKTLKDEKFILISSSYHLPRAVAIFEKEGLNPIVSTGHFMIKDSDKILSIPKAKHLEKTEVALHEYIGILWAKLRGQI